MRKFARYLALALVAFTSGTGFMNVGGGFDDPSATMLQQSVLFGGILHAVLGVFVILGALRRRPWVITVAVCWAIAVMYTATVASIAWVPSRDGTALFSAFAAGAACALFGWWVVWAAKESGVGRSELGTRRAER